MLIGLASMLIAIGASFVMLVALCIVVIYVGRRIVLNSRYQILLGYVLLTYFDSSDCTWSVDYVCRLQRLRMAPIIIITYAHSIGVITA